MSEYFKGTLVASPLVRGSSGDTYGTHHSILGVGGYMEVKTTLERNLIPIDINTGLDYDNISSGQRRLGMLVNVLEENKIYKLYVDYVVWDGLSNEDKLNALINNSNWVELEIGGSEISDGENISKTFYKVSHGFVVGEVIQWDLNLQSYEKGIALSGDTEILGIVSEIVDINNFKILFSGYLNLTGTTVVEGGIIQANKLYYVSTTTAGKLTTSQPTLDGELSKPILITTNDIGDGTLDSIVFQYRATLFNSLNSSGGTSISCEHVSKQYEIPSHGFIVKDVLALENGVFIKAIADGSMTTEIIGVVSKIIDLNNFIITYSGFIPNILGLLNNTTYYLSTVVEGGLTATTPTQVGEVIKPVLITKDNNEAIVLSYEPELILTTTGGTSTIGEAEDGDYTDGYFVDIESTMRAGIPIDRFNELFKLILPQPAPTLSDISGSGSFVDGFLSFGVSKNDTGYINVNTNAGNSVVDINELYSVGGTRLGLTQGNLSGIINDSIVGDVSGIPYVDNAIGSGEIGLINITLNGTLINNVDLSTTTNSITSVSGGTTLSFSELKSVKLNNGNDVDGNYYRTGTYDVNTSAMVNGFNYMIINHTISSTTNSSNYLEWVYDPESTSINISSISFDSITLNGIKYLSGVKYNVSGFVNVNSTAENAYKNVYYSGNGVDYPSKVNLGNPSSILIESILTATGTSAQLPELRTDVTNPQNAIININSVLAINNVRVLGNVGTLGKLETNNRIIHPFSSKIGTSSPLIENGFLIYNVNQTNDLNDEDLTGEVNRLESRDYSVLTYSNINGGVYGWNTTKSLVGVDTLYNDGLLVFDGGLIYPNSVILNDYGINDGNFDGVTHSPTSNVNYVGAGGLRLYNRKFKSKNSTSQSTLSFSIENTGSDANFLTDGGTGGIPFGNNIKFEFLIVRGDNSKIGWANPFASTGNPSGIANTSKTHSGGITLVSCTLSLNRVGYDDLVIIRIKGSNSWNNKITNIKINNI